MIPKIRTAVFWFGLLVYATSFALPAIAGFNGVLYGYNSAVLSIMMVPEAIAGLLGSALRLRTFRFDSCQRAH